MSKLGESTLSVSERKKIMIKEVKYDGNLYQIETISKEINYKKTKWEILGLNSTKWNENFSRGGKL